MFILHKKCVWLPCFVDVCSRKGKKKKEVDSRDGGGATFAVWLLQCLDECQNKNKWLHEAYMLLKHPEWLINNNDSPVKSLLWCCYQFKSLPKWILYYINNTETQTLFAPSRMNQFSRVRIFLGWQKGTLVTQTVVCQFCHPLLGLTTKAKQQHKELCKPAAIHWFVNKIVTSLRRVACLSPHSLQPFSRQSLSTFW